jgi:hypothetical protein
MLLYLVWILTRLSTGFGLSTRLSNLGLYWIIHWIGFSRTELSTQKKELSTQEKQRELAAAATLFKQDLTASVDEMGQKGWFQTPLQPLEAYKNGIKLLSRDHPLAISHNATHWCSHHTVTQCPVTGDIPPPPSSLSLELIAGCLW